MGAECGRPPFAGLANRAVMYQGIPLGSRLTTIVQIPCRDTFTRVIGPHTLLFSAEARAVPDSYRSALALYH